MSARDDNDRVRDGETLDASAGEVVEAGGTLEGDPRYSDADAPPNVRPIGSAKKDRNEAAAPVRNGDSPESELCHGANLAAQIEGRAIYVAGLGWFVFEGQWWALDKLDAVREFAKNYATQARVAAAFRDNGAAQLLASRISTARGIDSLLRDAESDPRIRRSPEQLDAHPHLLNFPNGTVDLRTGELRAHDAADLLTHVCRADYVPGSTDPDLDRVLHHLVPDAAARDYLGRMVGYSITGDRREDVTPLLVGDERCGKSSLMIALRAALGSYYGTAKMDTFCVPRNRGGNPPRSDLFRLRACRVVVASEVHPGAEIDHGLLKALAGGEDQPVRDLHGKEIVAPWCGTVWLIANDGDLPKVRAEDGALWARIKRIPIGTKLAVADRDPDLRVRLQQDAARRATLAWAVFNAVTWYARGLGEAPASVAAASADLRHSMDNAAPWIAAHVTYDPRASTIKRLIREAYEQAADDAGEPALGAKRFAASLRLAGERAGVAVTECTIKHDGKTVDAWRGLRFSTEGERARREETAQKGGDGRTAKTPHAPAQGDLMRTAPPPPFSPCLLPSGDERDAYDTWRAEQGDA